MTPEELDYWKNVPKQTIFGFGDNPDEIGDCWRCCIAAILRRPAAEVPHFVEQHYHNHGWSPDIIAGKWLAAQGYRLLQTYPEGTWFGEIRCSESDWSELPAIVGGPTVRSKNQFQTHAVVKLGDVMYDPHPSEAGLLAETSRKMIVRSL